MRRHLSARRRGTVGQSRRHVIEQLEDRLLLVSDWQNPLLAADVDNNGFISAGDALAVIGDLRRNAMLTGRADRDLPPVTETVRPPPFLDVAGEGDNRVSAADALAVIAILRADTLPPTIAAGLANDTAPGGTVNDDRLTFDPTITGVVTDSSVGAFVPTGVALFTAQVDDEPPVSVAIDAQGQFNFHPGFPQDGTRDGDHVVRFQARDGRGNISPFFDVVFTLDTIAPTAPTFDLDAASDTGDPGDMQTTLDIVTFVGQTDPNVRVDLSEIGATTTSDNTGRFEFNGVPLSEGGNTYTAQAFDAAGNVSSSTQTITRISLTAQVLGGALGQAVPNYRDFGSGLVNATKARRGTLEIEQLWNAAHDAFFAELSTLEAEVLYQFRTQ